MTEQPRSDDRAGTGTPRAEGPPWRVHELLSARLCHELITPTNAAGNGLEILIDNPGDASSNPEDLVCAAEEIRRANNLLKFYRIAYGVIAKDGPGEGAGGTVVRLLTEGLSAMRIDWRPAAREPTSALLDDPRGDRLTRGQAARLMLNLHATGALALIHGGSLLISGRGFDGPSGPVAVVAEGKGARFKPEVAEAIRADYPVENLTPLTVQGFFTAWLARQAGFSLAVETESDRVRLVLLPAG